MAQIGGYLTPAEHAEFKEYAAEFQLKESGLANLLIARELRCRRLESLKDSFQANSPLKERSRITAHQPNALVKQSFEIHAKSCGVSPDQAASILFRAEIKERWLGRCIMPLESG